MTLILFKPFELNKIMTIVKVLYLVDNFVHIHSW